MTTVMAFGCFDIIHPGHMSYLSEAKKLGDRLIVVVARDKNIIRNKGTPKYSEKERLEHVRGLNISDKAVLGYEDDIFEIVEEYNPDIIAMGYDQEPPNETISRELKRRELKASVRRMSSHLPWIYKSSKLKSSPGKIT